VLSADPETGKQSYQKVTRAFVREADALVVIRTEDGRSVEATPDHPFWVEGKGFVEAKRLARSDLLRKASGKSVRVGSVTAKPGKVRVYNLEVEGTHTYYAGGLWVHNANCVLGKGTLAGDMASTPFKPGQFSVSGSKIDAIAEAMRNNPSFWESMGEPILVDANGVITSGHHRLIAAQRAGIAIPEGVIGRGTPYTGRPITWGEVWTLK
jgi:hypothetical protein